MQLTINKFIFELVSLYDMYGYINIDIVIFIYYFMFLLLYKIKKYIRVKVYK